MKTYNPTDNITCPHCDAEQEDAADDYAVPGGAGVSTRYETDCWFCGETFIAQRNEDGTIKIWY